MKNGYIKLYRKLLGKTYSKKPQYAWLWVYLLLRVNHDDAKFLWNGREQELVAGQFISGRKEISKETGIPESTTEDILTFFERQHQIRQQKNNKFRIITIENWHQYQDGLKNPTSNPTTGRQQADTNKNTKNKEEEGVTLLVNYFSSLCLSVGGAYAGSPKDEQRLREALAKHPADHIKKMMEAYIKRPEKPGVQKIYSINAALSSYSNALFEEEEKRGSWQY